MPAPIPVPVRLAILRRLRRRESAADVALALGLAPRTARHLAARLRRGGDAALRPTPRRRRATDVALSPALRMRRRHPTWGAPLIRLFLGERPALRPLVCPRTLQRWFRAAVLAPAPRGRRPGPSPRRARAPHEVWQMDAAERVPLADGSRVCWLRLADEFTGAVLASVVFARAYWSGVGVHAVQAELRKAFARWGRPLAPRTDNGQPWAQPREGLPAELGLWLAGLRVAIRYNPPRQPYRNGVVERSQGVSKAWAEPHACHGAAQLRRRLARMDRVQRERYPGPGRSRMDRHPGLQHSGRRYSRAWEHKHWGLKAARALLGGYVVPRRVRGGGSVSVYARELRPGAAWRGKAVLVGFDPRLVEWVLSDEKGQTIRRFAAPEICRGRIVGLSVCRTWRGKLRRRYSRGKPNVA